MSEVPRDLPRASVQEDGFAVPHSLQSSEQKRLLNIIDELRSWDVGDYLYLPQLIVCGIQSSGKSSVMEAISGVPFPRNVSTCTRFPTEITLRRENSTSVTVSISPGRSCSKKEHERLTRFKKHLNNYNEFPGLFEEASETLGLSDKKAFSDSTLRVEVTGPNQPQLELVDLPGLVASADDENVKLVEDLVRKYMANPRSIILAVVTAATDPDTQSVLKMAKEYDGQGTRTLGILTKPDLLEHAPVKEKQWKNVIRNEDEKFSFELGWHILRNVDSGREGTRMEEKINDRDQIEKQYFARSNFRADPVKHLGLGIATLRERLSRILFQQIQKHLGSVLKEIEAGIRHSKDELSKLGYQRSTYAEQRDFLINLSTDFKHLCLDAVRGFYVDKFFRDDTRPNTKLCAAVLNAHDKFASDVEIIGARWREIDDDSSIFTKGLSSNTYFLKRARDLLKTNRGRELRGHMNPAVIEQLFYECSHPWQRLAHTHLESQHQIVAKFLYEVLDFLADPETTHKVYSLWMSDRLQELFEDAKVELKKVLAVYQQQPMTANPLFFNRISELQRPKVSKVRKTSKNDNEEGHTSKNAISVLNPNHITAEMALGSVEAYYDATVPTYVDNVLTLAVWAPMVREIPDIFSPDKVNHMTTEEVQELAGESTERIEHRAEMLRKLEALERGRKACGVYTMPMREGRRDAASASPEPGDPDQLADDLQDTLNLNAKPQTEEFRTPSPARHRSNNNVPTPGFGSGTTFGSEFGYTPVKESKLGSTPSSRQHRQHGRLGNSSNVSRGLFPQYRNPSVESAASGEESEL